VVLRSGVALDGEIESASRASLSFDTDELDVVSIDLEDVVGLTSPGIYEVTLANGLIHFGSLAPADTGFVAVVSGGGTDTLSIGTIVSIRPLEEEYWSRTSGYLDVGASLLRANSLASLLTNGSFAYRGRLWDYRIRGEAYWQEQEVTDGDGQSFDQKTRRNSLSISLNRFVGFRWSAQVTGDWERNDELDLESRFQFGVQGIYDIIKNQEMELQVGAGLANNTEDYVDADQETSAEVRVGGALDIFDMGDVDLYTSLVSFTNLNNSGRYRIVFNGRISWEIVDDFFIGLTLLERYDRRPPAPDSPKRDYQYGFTIGWSWS
jgi:hypothetical protein